MSQFLTLVKLTSVSLFTVAAGVSLGLALLIASAPIEHKLVLTSSIVEPNINDPLPTPLYASLLSIDPIATPEIHINNVIGAEDDDDGGDCS